MPKKSLSRKSPTCWSINVTWWFVRGEAAQAGETWVPRLRRHLWWPGSWEHSSPWQAPFSSRPALAPRPTGSPGPAGRPGRSGPQSESSGLLRSLESSEAECRTGCRSDWMHSCRPGLLKKEKEINWRITRTFPNTRGVMFFMVPYFPMPLVL